MKYLLVINDRVILSVLSSKFVRVVRFWIIVEVAIIIERCFEVNEVISNNKRIFVISKEIGEKGEA
jgi:hypothetical protein